MKPPFIANLNRGDDTRWTFSDHLYTALFGSGFRTFVEDDDDELIQRGGNTSKLELKRALIKQSRSSIIVFSKDYVYSDSCLDELVMILEHKRESKHVVLPVFYDLDPSHVRKQMGIVEEAFSMHEARVDAGSDERKNKYESDKVEGWRAALREVADLAGMVLQNQADGYESKFIKIIVQEIANKLDRTVLSITPYPTGIDSRVNDINLWLQDGSNNSGIMVIYGMGGIGKTTLAKIAYNQNFDRFESSSFLADIRESSTQPNGLLRLQKQLLSNILKRKKKRIHNVDEGIIKIKDAMCCKRVLVVLDDVDELDQLNAILGMRDWLHPGSKIIITTRRERILKAHERCEMYKVKELSDVEALCLFCRHAFGQDHPVEPYVEQSKKATYYCNGLPLALEVLGSSLSGENVDVWESALTKLGRFSKVKLHNVLQISYDCLDDHDKDLFLDIVCFFAWKGKDHMVKILDGCDIHTTVGVQNLIRRCLVGINEVDNNTLIMHQLLRDMGREIIRQESPKEPGRRSRVWHHKDAFNVLNENTGTEAIEGLILDLQEQKEEMRVKKITNPKLRHIAHLLCERRSSKRRRLGWLPIHYASTGQPSELGELDLKTDAFSQMHKLRILQLYDVHLSGGYDEFPKKLRWLCWHGLPLTVIPDDFPLENMVVLEFSNSSLKQFWKGSKLLEQLKILNLTRSYDLTSSPDFSKLPNLERLILKDCIKLVEVHESIVELGRLVLLNLKGCKNLKKLPRKISQLNTLEKLNISGCSKLDELPTDLGEMKSLREFQADGVNMLSSTTGEVKSWQAVVKSLVSKPSKRPVFSLASLPKFVVYLSLEDCNLTDNTFPKDLSSMPLLQGLRLSRNPICNLPESIKNLSALMELDLQRCTKLQALPELPMSLLGMTIYGCKSLERVTNLPNLLNSLMLSTYGCVKLVEVEGMFKLESIDKIDSETMDNLGLSQLESMDCLDMKLLSNLTFTKRKVQELQVLYECGTYSIFLPGNAVPSWFNNKSTGSAISFNVPWLPNLKTWGLKICICYAVALDFKKATWMNGCIIVSNKTKGKKWTYRPAFIGIAEEGKDILWLSDWKSGNQLMERGDEVTVSVNMEEYYQVKEFGIRIGCNEQENEREDGTQRGNGIDLSVYQMREGQYFLCNHEDFVRSSCYSRIAAGSRLDLVETCLCGFQCEKHAKQ
ncbi:unnamed protein product [Camellia sinensis]